MKNITKLLLILALTITSIFYGQEDCKNFRNGTFKLVDKTTGTVFLIVRKGNMQTEEIEGNDDKVSFHVNWISDCKYTLYPTKETLAKNKDFAGYLYVEITEVREKSIIIKSTMKEYPEMEIFSELTKLD